MTTHDPKAKHGYRSEVSWDHGQGRQPYQNQGDKEQGPANGGDEFTAGHRGALSGNHQEQMEQARGVPVEGALQNAEEHQQKDDRQRDAE